MSRSQNLKSIVEICTELNVDFAEVEFYGGYKQVLFTLPDRIIESLRDETGDLTEKYDEFCDKYSTGYDSEWDAWN